MRLSGLTELSDYEFLALGENKNLLDLDMIIGSSDMDVDGIIKKNKLNQ